MNNKEVRQWYKKQVSKIPALNESWIASGLDAWERARLAWEIRHNARLKARELMQNQREVEDLRNRDRRIYGNPDGPTFEFLIAKAQSIGLKGDKIYNAIIEGAIVTNADVDKKF